MGIAERKEREKLKRRNEILDAAERVIFSKGLDGASMDAVAAEAELSKGTIYLYFSSKEELYLAINIRASEILYKLFKKAVDSRKSGFDKVFAIGEAYFHFGEKYPNYFNSLFHFQAKNINLDPNSPTILENYDWKSRTNTIVSEAVEAGIKDGSIRSGIDPVGTAILLWALSSGAIQMIAIKGEIFEKAYDLSAKALKSQFFDLIAAALKPV